MKILFLNLWHGKLEEPLKKFLSQQQDVDVFCFQEAEHNACSPDFFSKYQKFVATKHVGHKANFDQAIYVRSQYQVSHVTELLQNEYESGLALALTITTPEEVSYQLVNLHGTARRFVDGTFAEEDNKRDFPARIKQSERVLEHVGLKALPTIIAGDFNILPDTESLEIFRRAGYRDLIREYNIETTRNHLSWGKYPESDRHYFSDYCFVSPELHVRSFEVPNVEVSDHLPMILEIEL